MPDYPIHEAAKLFPPMSAEEFAGLVADIREHGQREPIILHDGAVIDGRNRYLACKELGIAPRTVEWDGVGSVEAFVVSKNLHRRHLNESQRAMVAARLATLRAGDNQHSTKQVAAIAATSAGEPPPPPVSARTAQSEAAKLLNVSRSSVQRARTVIDKGTDEEIKSVDQGTAAVSAVAKDIKARQPKATSGGPVNVSHLKDYRGRTYPKRPVAERMERGLDQLDNALEAIVSLMDESADGSAMEAEWVRRLECARTALTRAINVGRQRSAA